MTFQSLLLAILMGLAGAVFLVWGYRLFLTLLPIWGFFGGFWIGAQLAHLFLGAGFLGSTSGWVIGLLAGTVGALLSFWFYLGGIFLVVAAFAVIVITGILGVLGLSGSLLASVLTLAAGIALGLAAVRNNWQMYLVVVVTTLSGANLLISAVLLVVRQIEIEDIIYSGSIIRPVLTDSWIWLLVWLLLAAGGSFLQLQRNRRYLFQKESYFDNWG